MKLAIGVVLVVVGIILIVWGYNTHQSLGGQLTEAFTGSPSDKSMYLYIGGAVLTILGAFQVFRKLK